MRGRGKAEPTALARAVGLLSRREHSRKELKRKLDARGVEPDAIDAALDRLGASGLLDEQRFVEMLIRTRSAAGQGPLRIRAELATHQLADDAIERGFDELAIDWDAQAVRVIERRYGHAELAADRTLQRKAIEFLLRRGFDLDTARGALQRVLASVD